MKKRSQCNIMYVLVAQGQGGGWNYRISRERGGTRRIMRAIVRQAFFFYIHRAFTKCLLPTCSQGQSCKQAAFFATFRAIAFCSRNSMVQPYFKEPFFYPFRKSALRQPKPRLPPSPLPRPGGRRENFPTHAQLGKLPYF